MSKKIILSGGWGYGNLGDEAILDATITLLRDIFPNCEIIVLSYTPALSENKKWSNVSYIESFHRFFYNADYFKNHKLIFNRKSLISNFFILNKKRIFSRIERCVKGKKKEDFEDIDDYLTQLPDNIKKIFENCDFYVMSGGHFINKWQNSIFCKLLEVSLAKRKGKNVYILGQTFGPFDEYTIDLFNSLIAMTDAISVRDRESLVEIKDENKQLNTILTFDIALYVQEIVKKEKIISIVPFYYHNNYKIIIEDLLSFCNKGYEINIVLSQNWFGPYYLAEKIVRLFKLKGINANLIIPNSHEELQRHLGQSELVLSQNLHGLIMAFRAKTKIICLNEKRKFITFMELAQLQDSFVPIEKLRTEQILKLTTKSNEEYPLDLLKKKIFEDALKIFAKELNE